MAVTLSEARAHLQTQSKEDAFENVYNSLVLEAPEKENELCHWCHRGWKSLLFDGWCEIADSKGWKPNDLRIWGELLALYDRLKREHENACKRIPPSQW